MSGSGISWAICKSAPCSRQITTPAPHHSVFYRPDALAVAQITASKHRRHKLALLNKYKNICTRNTSKYKKHFHFSSKLGFTSFFVDNCVTFKCLRISAIYRLGCVHDQLDNRCSAADLYIMAASAGPLTDDIYRNAYQFSHCSISEMHTFLAILTQWVTSRLTYLLTYYRWSKHTHTHPFNCLFFGTIWVIRYQKSKADLDFTEARDSEWRWHQLGHIQVCTSLQTDNHASIPPLSFFTGRMSFLPPNQQRQSTRGRTGGLKYM